MNVLLTALLGVLVGWYLRHVLAGSKTAALESQWLSSAKTWSQERDSLIVSTADLSKRSSALEIELGTTTAEFTRRLERNAREHDAEISALREQMTLLERERNETADQFADVVRKSASLDGELRATLARHRTRSAQVQEELVLVQRHRAAAEQERDAARQRATELEVATASIIAQWEARHAHDLAQLGHRLEASEQERERHQRHLTELTRRAAATEAELHAQITMLQARVRTLTTRGVPGAPGRGLSAFQLKERLPQRIDGLAAQAASALSAWQERTQQLDGQLHALLNQSEAHRARYQKHLEAIRHELAAAQSRLEHSRGLAGTEGPPTLGRSPAGQAHPMPQAPPA